MGQLVDDFGRPIAGACLELGGESTDLKVLTDRHGRFRFQNLAHGDYTLRSGRHGRRFSVELHQKEIPFSLPVGPTGLYLPEIAGAPGLVVDGDSSSSIAGIVSTCGSRPLAGVDVIVRSRREGGRPIEVVVRTDDRGRYLAENLPPGRYHIRADGPRGFRPPSAKLDLAPDTRVTQYLVASPHGAGDGDPWVPLAAGARGVFRGVDRSDSGGSDLRTGLRGIDHRP